MITTLPRRPSRHKDLALGRDRREDRGVAGRDRWGVVLAQEGLPCSHLRVDRGGAVVDHTWM